MADSSGFPGSVEPTDSCFLIFLVSFFGGRAEAKRRKKKEERRERSKLDFLLHSSFLARSERCSLMKRRGQRKATKVYKGSIRLVNGSKVPAKALTP